MIYTILDKNTNEEFDVECSWKEFETILKENSDFEQVFKMNLAYRIGRLKVSESWREKLRGIKKANRNSTVEIP